MSNQRIPSEGAYDFAASAARRIAQYNVQIEERCQTRFQWLMRRLSKIYEVLRPYIRITRVLVIFIAPIALALLYLLHKSYRTKQMQEFMRNFCMDRAFMDLSKLSSRLGSYHLWGSGTQRPSMMDMAQHNDVLWVRLSQVVSSIIGY